MFFDRLKQLCDDRGISVYRACTDIGLNRSAVAKWKNGGQPNGSTAAKLADYFNVTTDYLLGKDEKRAPAEIDRREVSKDDIIFALFRGRQDITDEMYQEVQNFADYVAQREDAKKKKN